MTPATAAMLHAPAPPVGFVEVIAFVPSTATHSDADGHETELRYRSSPILTTFHAPAPPAGLVDDAIVPREPTATHSDDRGHETAASSRL